MKDYLNTRRVMNLEKKLLFKSLRDQDRRDRADWKAKTYTETRRTAKFGKNQKPYQQSTRMTLIGKAVTSGNVGAVPCDVLFSFVLFSLMSDSCVLYQT
jgi:hypothetical protein